MAKRLNVLERAVRRAKQHVVFTALALVASLVLLVGSLVIAWSNITTLFARSPYVYTEIVVDASRHMTESYDGTTRFDIAQAEALSLLSVPGIESQVIGLRIAGSQPGQIQDQICNDSQLLVKLGYGQAGRARNALNGLKPKGGGAPLGRAVLAAMNDFNDARRYPPEKVKTIVLVTAGIDACPQSTADLERQMASFPNMRVDAKIIGLGVVRAQDVAGLRALASHLKAEVTFVSKPEELRQVLRDVVIRRPFLNNQTEILDGLHGMVDKLNNATRATNPDDVGGAKTSIAEAEEYFAKTDTLFQQLAPQKYNDSAAQIIELMKLMREDQGKCLSYARQMVGLVPLNHDSEKIQRYNQLADSYSKTAAEFNKRQEQSRSLVQGL